MRPPTYPPCSFIVPYSLLEKRIIMKNNNFAEQKIIAEFNSVDISVKLGRLAIEPTDSNVASLEYTRTDNYSFVAEINNDTLSIKSVDSRGLFERIFFHIPKVILHLPKKEYDALSVHLMTGKLEVNDISVKTLDIRNVTTKVWLTDTVLNECATVAVTTGKVCVTDMKCRRLEIRTGCGSVALDGVFADERIDVKSTTGSISLNNSNAPKCSFRATTGRIKGKLNSFD